MSKMIFAIAFIFSAFFYAGCGGHEPNPVALHQVGDDRRSCQSLRLEIAQNDAIITKKVKKDEGKFWSNTLWLLFFTPAMDFKEAEKTEAEALQHRNDLLKILMAEKGCGATPLEDKDRYWMNRNGIRHNSSCKYYMNSEGGRLCTKDEGKACTECGG